MGEKEEKPDGQEKNDGDGQGKKNQEKQPQKDRYVWSDERHGMFLKALQELEEEGRDIVPKNIKEKMKLQGEKIKREQVSSHLQKYRENLARQKKREEEEEALAKLHQREEDIGWKDAAAAGAPEGPSPSPYPLPEAHLPSLPPAAADAPAPDVPQHLQTGQRVVQPPGTPPLCLGSSGDIVAATALLQQQQPQLEAVAVPIAEQVRRCSALPPLQPDAAAARRRLVMWEQPARSQQNHVAAAAAALGACAPMLMNHNDRMSFQMMRAHLEEAAAHGAHSHRTPPEPHVQACPAAPAIGGECSAAEANMRYEEAEIRKAQQLRAAAMAEEGEGEGQERAAEAEADEAVAGSPSPHDSIVARFWKSDDPEPSWDFLGMPRTRSF